MVYSTMTWGNSTSYDNSIINASGTGNTGGASGSTANSAAFNTGGNLGNTANAGSGGGHNHSFTGTNATISTMPPYLSVYMWKRTA